MHNIIQTGEITTPLLFLVCAVLMAMGVRVAMRKYVHMALTKRTVVICAVVMCVFMISLVIGHYKACCLLVPIKSEFAEVAVRRYSIKEVSPPMADRTFVVLEYGGRLDAVIAKRDKALAENGFVMLGNWMASGEHGDISYSACYLYVGR